MRRHQLLIGLALLQAPLCHINGQTCPLDQKKLTITKDGTPTPGLKVVFEGCDCLYGPSNSDGEVNLSSCPNTNSAAITPSRDLSKFSRSMVRNASLVAAEAPVLTVVVKNQDQEMPDKNAILSFIQSGTGTAILVALITGLFGTLITHLLQKRKFQQDLALQEQYKRDEEGRTRFSKDLDNERDFVRSAYQLVGRCIAAGDDLLAIATPEFQSKTPGPGLVAAQERLRSTFDGTEEAWKAERYSTDLLIKLYHVGENQIQQIWGEIDVAIATYFAVCKEKFNEYRTLGTLVTSQQKAAMRNDYVDKIVDALRRLTVEIAAARQSSNSGIGAAAVVETIN